MRGLTHIDFYFRVGKWQKKLFLGVRPLRGVKGGGKGRTNKLEGRGLRP